MDIPQLPDEEVFHMSSEALKTGGHIKRPLSGFLFTFRYLYLFSSFLLHPAVQQQFKYRHLCCELVPHLSCLDVRICLLTDAYAGKQLLLRK